MRRTKHFALIALTLSLLMGCQKEPSKYDRPDWLAGKLFTQISDTTIFNTFTRCLELTGYDTIIDASGSYTVFAPNDDAFDLYFQEHPNYNTPEDIPKEELTRLVKYHIVQNPWSRRQLTMLDVEGWIDPQDETNNEPRGYKRETILEDKDTKYGLKEVKGIGITLVNTTESDWVRRVYTDSRKYAPIFYIEYFDIYNLNLSDYEFYFDRPFESAGDIYFADAKLLGEEIFAENGFIFNVDRVVEPEDNAYQILRKNEKYSEFLDLINQYPEFEYNQTETFNQPEALAGFEFDSLFELSFPDLAFDLNQEKTEPPPGTYGLPGEVTIRFHHGLLAPTNDAIAQFNSTYLPGGDYWPGIQNTPENIRNLFINTHMSFNAIYPTDIEEGIFNGELDRVTFDPSTISEKIYASNATFLGLDEAVVPRAFSSITGPVFLRRGYSKVMYAIEQSGLLPALKRERESFEKFMFFVESDAFSQADSSFMYSPSSTDDDQKFWALPVGANFPRDRRFYNLTDLRTLLMNHVAVRQPTGIPRKEFIPNLAGNYIVFNNVTGEVRGNGMTTEGYQGVQPVMVIPEQIDDNADNGSTYSIQDWFSFPAKTLQTILPAAFPEFYQLIIESGLAPGGDLTDFYSPGEQYTIFAMDSLAVEDVRADSLPQDSLQNLILNHFIRKKVIFTDGYEPAGYYETLRRDEKSSEFNILYSKIYIDPGFDRISFGAKSGGTYETVNEGPYTNILVSQLISEGRVTYEVTRTSAVIHSISKPLRFDELDVYDYK